MSASETLLFSWQRSNSFTFPSPVFLRLTSGWMDTPSWSLKRSLSTVAWPWTWWGPREETQRWPSSHRTGWRLKKWRYRHKLFPQWREFTCIYSPQERSHTIFNNLCFWFTNRISNSVVLYFVFYVGIKRDRDSSKNRQCYVLLSYLWLLYWNWHIIMILVCLVY